MTTFVYDDYRATPESSVIDKAYWSDQDKELVIQFKNGNLAAYGCNYSDWQDYLSASSVGRFYNNEVKGVFEGFDASYDGFARRGGRVAAYQGDSGTVDTTGATVYHVTYAVKAGSLDELAAIVRQRSNYDDLVKVEKV